MGSCETAAVPGQLHSRAMGQSVLNHWDKGEVACYGLKDCPIRGHPPSALAHKRSLGWVHNKQIEGTFNTEGGSPALSPIKSLDLQPS